MASLRAYLAHPQLFRQLMGENGGQPDLSVKTIDQQVRPFIEAALQDYPQRMDALISMVKQPYADWTDPPASPVILSNAFLLASFHKAGFMSLYNDTQNRLLAVACALQAWKCDHHAYPESLSALCPAYLSAIPADPFAVNAPLCYQKTDQDYLLYSIGPDGKDDGGTPIEDAQAQGPHQVSMDSIGDIVAGVNINCKWDIIPGFSGNLVRIGSHR